ncbi:IS6 family transposase [Streptomyces bingchenggensis BCW-1]|uniref:IS6 family transposase n=2 Tax=Streptomyces TaxID=1883 RepID=D7C7K7_STRBB|nr:IS6 family transposase [Streptomyces bingchenggensis BCW-1]
MLVSVGLALAGWAGARTTDVFRVLASRNTLLRRVTSLPDPATATPRVVGVDEYAQCKGRVYGTVLVDVETRRPIGLLPDREADMLAAWLTERPGIEITCRDRAPFSPKEPPAAPHRPSRSLTDGHLWHNLGEAAEKCIYRHRGCLRPTPGQPEEPQEEAEPAALSPRPTGHRFAERTRAKHATIHTLLAAGHSKRSVARQLGMTLNTILRFSRATTLEEMFTGQWQSRVTRLDDYKPYLDQRWQEGCTNAWNCGRRSRNRAIRVATAASVTMSAGLFGASPNQSGPAHHRPVPSPAGSSPTPTPYPKATGSSSRVSWPTAPN